MTKDTFIRRVLWATAVFNLGGALLFAFPGSRPGQLVGLPAPVPAAYSVLLAFFVLLFGGAYAWLALQPTIDRPLVGFAAIGKTGAFCIALALWLIGEAPARSVLAVSGDLVFAGLFFWWLAARPIGRPAGLPAGSSAADRSMEQS
jgi:hypothetical protein